MNTNEVIKILKENAGLKAGYERYKRKYKAINRFVCKTLYLKIEGLAVQWRALQSRANSASTKEEYDAIWGVMNHITKERQELQKLYDICKEIDSIT